MVPARFECYSFTESPPGSPYYRRNNMRTIGIILAGLILMAGIGAVTAKECTACQEKTITTAASILGGLPSTLWMESCGSKVVCDKTGRLSNGRIGCVSSHRVNVYRSCSYQTQTYCAQYGRPGGRLTCLKTATRQVKVCGSCR